jgi:hypothetical protein
MMIDSIAKFIHYSLKSLFTMNKGKKKKKKKDFIIEKDEVKNPPYKSHNQINKSLEGVID